MTRSSSITAFACFVSITGAFAGPTNEEQVKDFRLAIHDMFRDPADVTHGLAIENSGDYGNSIEVTWTGPFGESVEKQMRDTAEAALRVGDLALDRHFIPPGKDLIIAMSLRGNDGMVGETFTVRYKWNDVLKLAKAHAKIGDLAPKGKIERIRFNYWPTMCLNPPPPELFAGGDGDPQMPEDVENPTGKDLSCHRKR